MPQTALAPGLTTGHAPFVEEARERGELYISQPYDQYSEENHESWRRLFSRIQPRWERFANPHFLHGIDTLNRSAGDVLDRHGWSDDTKIRGRPKSHFIAQRSQAIPIKWAALALGMGTPKVRRREATASDRMQNAFGGATAARSGV